MADKENPFSSLWSDLGITEDNFKSFYNVVIDDAHQAPKDAEKILRDLGVNTESLDKADLEIFKRHIDDLNRKENRTADEWGTPQNQDPSVDL